MSNNVHIFEKKKNSRLLNIILVSLVIVVIALLVYLLLPKNKEKIISFQIENKELYVKIGEQEKLKAKLVVNEEIINNAIIKWDSSNISIGSISTDGTVLGNQLGSFIVMATYVDENGKEYKDTANIIVYQGTLNKPVEKIEVKDDNIELKIGDKLEIKDIFSIIPEDGYITKYEINNDNSSVVSLSNEIVTAESEGTSKITIIVNNSILGSVNINVIKEEVIPPKIKVESVSFKDKSPLTIKTGDSKKLEITINPSDANIEQQLWKSSNEKVVTVDNLGNIKGISAGEAKITVSVDGVTVEIKVEVENRGTLASTMLKDKIKKSNCSSTYTDTDGTIYFSGENSCVSYNYLWYSGQLWRILALYKDGSIKLITDDNVVSLGWGKNIEYKGSWAYQWLNEDFYDTLENKEKLVINNSVWNYGNNKSVNAPVGLLSTTEYNLNCRNTVHKKCYLHIGLYWWLINARTSTDIWSINYESGSMDGSGRNPATNARGIRPVIYLKNDVSFLGSGTKNDPFTITSAKSAPKKNDLLNTRSSGEYVKFNNDLYRIVSIEDNKTKLMRVNFLVGNNGSVLKQPLSSSVFFGKSTNSMKSEYGYYWDYYLNNIWYNNIPTNYKNMMDDGTYYLGFYPYNSNYKGTICSDNSSLLDTITTKNCHKYTKESGKTFTGKVGIIRASELFATTPSYSREESWTLTPFSDQKENDGKTYMRHLLNTGNLYKHTSYSAFHSVRPTIHIKATVKITSGLGTSSSPFEISL